MCYIDCDGFISNHTNNNTKQSTIDSNPIFSNIESTSNNSTNQPFSYQDSNNTAKANKVSIMSYDAFSYQDSNIVAQEIINNDNTTSLIIETKTNLLKYQGNIADTLISGISGVFASIV